MPKSLRIECSYIKIRKICYHIMMKKIGMNSTLKIRINSKALVWL